MRIFYYSIIYSSGINVGHKYIIIIIPVIFSNEKFLITPTETLYLHTRAHFAP